MGDISRKNRAPVRRFSAGLGVKKTQGLSAAFAAEEDIRQAAGVQAQAQSGQQNGEWFFCEKLRSAIQFTANRPARYACG